MAEIPATREAWLQELKDRIFCEFDDKQEDGIVGNMDAVLYGISDLSIPDLYSAALEQLYTEGEIFIGIGEFWGNNELLEKTEIFSLLKRSEGNYCKKYKSWSNHIFEINDNKKEYMILLTDLGEKSAKRIADGDRPWRWWEIDESNGSQ